MLRGLICVMVKGRGAEDYIQKADVVASCRRASGNGSRRGEAGAEKGSRARQNTKSDGMRWWSGAVMVVVMQQ